MLILYIGIHIILPNKYKKQCINVNNKIYRLGSLNSYDDYIYVKSFKCLNIWKTYKLTIDIFVISFVTITKKIYKLNKY